MVTENGLVTGVCVPNASHRGSCPWAWCHMYAPPPTPCIIFLTSSFPSRSFLPLSPSTTNPRRLPVIRRADPRSTGHRQDNTCTRTGSSDRSPCYCHQCCDHSQQARGGVGDGVSSPCRTGTRGAALSPAARSARGTRTSRGELTAGICVRGLVGQRIMTSGKSEHYMVGKRGVAEI